MIKISKKRGQSLVEFALIFPFFLLLVLGLVQLSIIFLNAMMLNYTAYMTARVAAVYENKEVRQKKAETAAGILKLMTASANSIDKDPVSPDTAVQMLLGAGADVLGNFVGNLSDNTQSGVVIEKEEFENSKAGAGGDDDEAAFIRVTATYHMPLQVPFVNKIFGLFGTDIDADPRSLATDLFTGDIFKTGLSGLGKILANSICPYFTLKAQAVMRVG
jgi:hypothetical protein